MTPGGERRGPVEAVLAWALLASAVLAAFFFLVSPAGLPDLSLDDLPGRAAVANAAEGAEAPAPPFPGFPMDLNTSTAEELRALPGVGPVTARRIVELRSNLGGYSSPEELLSVKWIGPSRLAELRPLVRVTGPRDGD